MSTLIGLAWQRAALPRRRRGRRRGRCIAPGVGLEAEAEQPVVVGEQRAVQVHLGMREHQLRVGGIVEVDLPQRVAATVVAARSRPCAAGDGGDRTEYIASAA
ncbi:MAG: hypothetical protein U1F06_02070 [Steroidobacteraceae bacterium]